MSSGSVEALNRNVKLVTKRARGFRSVDVAKTTLLHAQGHLPTPEFTHRFCGRAMTFQSDRNAMQFEDYQLKSKRMASRSEVVLPNGVPLLVTG